MAGGGGGGGGTMATPVAAVVMAKATAVATATTVAAGEGFISGTYNINMGAGHARSQFRKSILKMGGQTVRCRQVGINT